jgi:predicted molibdopterin-dependent oxidoreductase YjgC
MAEAFGRTNPSSHFTVDGREVPFVEGQSVAAALLAAGIRTFRHDLLTGEPRGPFCGMGVCMECEVDIDGRRLRACLEPAADQMQIRLGSPGVVQG